MEEQRLGKAHFGSTLRGIAPAYADRAYKKALRMGDLLHEKTLETRLQRLVDWKNEVTVPGYGCEPYQYDELLAYCKEYAEKLRPYICNAGRLLEERQDKGILFEAQLGALRDLDYGIYPYTSSSTPLAAYAPVGCGLPSVKVDRVVGVVKAYSTCVGEGPFVGELQGTRPSPCARLVMSMARPRAVRAASPGWTWLPRATACVCRLLPSWR